MRHLIIFSFLFSAAFCYRIDSKIDDYNSIDPYMFEDLINSTIEGFRANIPDPLEIETYGIVLPNGPDDLLTGSANISNLYLAGLKGFQVQALNFNLIGFKLNLTLGVPKIELKTDYNLNMSLVDTVAIYGAGNASVLLEETELQLSVQLNVTDGISVNNLRVQLLLGTAKFEIHGLFNDEELSDLLSSILNDLAVKLVDENQELITQIISPIIEDIINEILGSMLQPTTVAP